MGKANLPRLIDARESSLHPVNIAHAGPVPPWGGAVTVYWLSPSAAAGRKLRPDGACSEQRRQVASLERRSAWDCGAGRRPAVRDAAW